MKKKIQNKAETTRMAFIIDSHDDVLDFSSHREKLSDGILSGKEGEVSHIDSSRYFEGSLILLKTVVVLSVVVSIFSFRKKVHLCHNHNRVYYNTK